MERCYIKGFFFFFFLIKNISTFTFVYTSGGSQTVAHPGGCGLYKRFLYRKQNSGDAFVLFFIN